MKKLILALTITVCSIAFASPGEKPFPYGVKTEFPWQTIEGCWKSDKSTNISLNLKPIYVGGDKKIRISIKDNKKLFSGVGSVKHDTVSFLRILRTPRQSRELVHLRIGGYCVEADISANKTCKRVLGMSLIYDTRGETDQEDHILIRASEKTCEDLRP